jgi:hypothetical protein
VVAPCRVCCFARFSFVKLSPIAIPRFEIASFARQAGKARNDVREGCAAVKLYRCTVLTSQRFPSLRVALQRRGKQSNPDRSPVLANLNRPLYFVKLSPLATPRFEIALFARQAGKARNDVREGRLSVFFILTN